MLLDPAFQFRSDEINKQAYLGLQYALPEVGDHEEELQGRGHVAGGTQVLDATVARLASPVVLRPVLEGVGLVRF